MAGLQIFRAEIQYKPKLQYHSHYSCSLESIWICATVSVIIETQWICATVSVIIETQWICATVSVIIETR